MSDGTPLGTTRQRQEGYACSMSVLGCSTSFDDLAHGLISLQNDAVPL